MLYEIISWIRFRGWYRLEGCAGHPGGSGRSARDEHPLVASDGQVRGRGVSGRVESGRWEREEERTGRGLHVPLPVREHAWGACDSPVRVDGWERWEGPLCRRLERSRSPGTSPE